MEVILFFIYQISNLFILHIGNYYNVYFYQEYVGYFLLGIIFICYLISFIKKKEYMDKFVILFYFLSILVNYLSLTFIPTDMFDSFLLIVIGIFIGIVSINGLVKLLVKERNKNKKNKLSILSIIFLLFSLFLPVLYGVIGYNFNEKKIMNLTNDYLHDNYNFESFILNKNNSKCDQFRCEFEYSPKGIDEYIIISVIRKNFIIKDKHLYCIDKNSCFDKAKRVADTYLKEKYGNFSYKYDDKNSNSSRSKYVLYFDSPYTEEKFYVEVSKVDYTVLESDFLLLYFSKMYGEKFKYENQLSDYLSDKIKFSIEEELFDTYDAKITYGGVSLDIESIKKEKFGKLPVIEDLRKFVTLRRPKIVVQKSFTNKDLELFKEYIIGMYEDIGEDDTMFFDFSYTNPFAEGNSAYHSGGYIRDSGSMYLLYLKPKPYQINK